MLMFDAKKLWKQRYSQYFTEISRYLKYILNGHLMIALLILIGGLSIQYSSWIENLPEGFPAFLLISVLLAIPLTNSQIQTLLKEPDIVYLFQVETKLTPYFQKAFISSLIFQSYIVIVFLAVLAPLYFKVTGNSFLALLVIFFVLLLQKVWNLLIAWSVNYFHEKWSRNVDTIVRFFINFTLTYLVIKEANFLFIVGVIVIMIILLVYFQQSTSNKSLNWERLIELESRRMITFYRLANLFTDVPKLKERTKRRKWLDWATRFIPYHQSSTYGYLYLRTFLRSSDYLGLYIRLVIIGSALLYYLPLKNGTLFIMLLFVYLTGFQLMTLWRQHSLKLWVDLYPVPENKRLVSFLRLIVVLLIIQSIVYSLLVFANGLVMQALTSIMITIGFSYLFVYIYIKGKIKKLS
jgi:ABC-2 type transport system permease protein